MVASLRGRLLVATPALADPNFERTVVLLIEHGEEGALGVVLNRRSDVALDDVLPGWRMRAAAPPDVFWGGPVSPGALICLGRWAGDGPRTGFQAIVGDLGAVDVEEDVQAVPAVVVDLRLFSGYAGWGPGQLEGELREAAWIVVDAEVGDGACADPEEQWRTVLGRQPGQLGWLANFPPDPSLN